MASTGFHLRQARQPGPGSIWVCTYFSLSRANFPVRCKRGSGGFESAAERASKTPRRLATALCALRLLETPPPTTQYLLRLQSGHYRLSIWSSASRDQTRVYSGKEAIPGYSPTMVLLILTSTTLLLQFTSAIPLTDKNGKVLIYIYLILLNTHTAFSMWHFPPIPPPPAV